MAKKSAKNDAPRTETLTIRLSPASRWCLELLARVHATSVAAQVQDAVSDRLNAEIQRLKQADDDLRSAGFALHQALTNTTATAYERVIHLRCSAPELLTRSEWQTLKLLEDLRLLRIDSIEEGDELIARYDALVIRAVWAKVEEAAESELGVDALGSLVTEIKKAEQLATSLG